MKCNFVVKMMVMVSFFMCVIHGNSTYIVYAQSNNEYQVQGSFTAISQNSQNAEFSNNGVSVIINNTQLKNDFFTVTPINGKNSLTVTNSQSSSQILLEDLLRIKNTPKVSSAFIINKNADKTQSNVLYIDDISRKLTVEDSNKKISVDISTVTRNNKNIHEDIQTKELPKNNDHIALLPKTKKENQPNIVFAMISILVICCGIFVIIFKKRNIV